MKRRKRQIKKYDIKSVLTILFVLVVILYTIFEIFFGKWSVVSLIKLQHKKSRLEKDLAITSSEIVLLEEEIKRYKEDSYFIEKIAREKAGMIKKGERRMFLPSPSKIKPWWKRWM